MKVKSESDTFFHSVYSFFSSLIKLARLKTSFLVGVTVACGYLIQSSSQSFSTNDAIKILFGIGSGFLVMAAMNTLNDVIDIDEDRMIKPNRVLPSGKISTTVAVTLFVIESLVGMILLYLLGNIPFLIGLFLLSMGISYSLWLQRIPFAKNILVGVSVASALLVGAFSVTPRISPKVWSLFGASFVGFVAFELHKDIGDLPGDIEAGKKTIPSLIGIKRSFFLAFLLYFLSFSSLVLILSFFKEPFWFVLLVGIVGFVPLALLLLSMKQINIDHVNRQRIMMMSSFAMILLLLLARALSDGSP